MRGIASSVVSLASVAVLTLGGLGACKKAKDDKPPEPAAAPSAGSGGASAMRSQQIAAPFDVKSPPADAIKTASGLVYKKVTANDAGAPIKRNDTVQVNYTGWKQATGETFFTNRARSQPMPLNLSQAAPGFVEAMQLLKKGERAMLWVPAEIGYKTAPTQGSPEALVYEVEVVDIVPAPAVPDDVAAPPAAAVALPSGTKRLVVRPGKGSEKPGERDNVTYQYTAWDRDGRMVDSSDARKRPATGQPQQKPPGMSEMLMSMVEGERTRFWVDAAKVAEAGKPVGGVVSGVLCYEIELTQRLAAKGSPPPPAPKDVAKPPADAKRTALGVSYKLLGKPAAKTAAHPTADDRVRVHYTGWTTDGKMFDSSVTRGEPAEFSLRGVIAGWTDGIPQMAVGEKVRFWIPEQHAYQGQPGKPAGMLVFDVELLEILKGGEPPMPPDPHGHHGHGH